MSAVKGLYVAGPRTTAAPVVSLSTEGRFVVLVRRAMDFQTVRQMQTVIRIQPVLLILAVDATFVLRLVSVGAMRMCLTAWNVPRTTEWFVNRERLCKQALNNGICSEHKFRALLKEPACIFTYRYSYPIIW